MPGLLHFGPLIVLSCKVVSCWWAAKAERRQQMSVDPCNKETHICIDINNPLHMSDFARRCYYFLFPWWTFAAGLQLKTEAPPIRLNTDEKKIFHRIEWINELMNSLFQSCTDNKKNVLKKQEKKIEHKHNQSCIFNNVSEKDCVFMDKTRFG